MKELDEEAKGLSILPRMQKSLIEFAQLGMNRNIMSRFLEGISLEEMKFVGIQEYFNEDLIYFCHLFGVDQTEPLEYNVTGRKQDVSKEIILEIAKLNALDMEIYNKGLELRKNRVDNTKIILS